MGRRKRRGESDDLHVRIEGTQLGHQQLDQITTRRRERLRLIDDQETDVRNATLQDRLVDKEIRLLDRRQKNVHAIVQVLRAIAVKAVDKDPVFLTDFLQIAPLLLQQRYEGKNDQTLAMPKQETAKQQNLVHERLSNTRWSRIHQVPSLQYRIVVDG